MCRPRRCSWKVGQGLNRASFEYIEHIYQRKCDMDEAIEKNGPSVDRWF